MKMYDFENFNNDRGLEFYGILYPSKPRPDWASNPLLTLTEELETCVGPASIMHINTALIVGSIHDDYKEKANWVEFPGSLKKIHSESDLRWYGEFFLRDVITKNDTSVKMYRGKYYIVSGNNRLCIAKFLGLKSIPVSVTTINK
jgi:hypothetical protein